ncbi:MAG: hypothetical protein JOZ51_27455 [Chloroflexi bacterium]|nr:hypothetical protein [Chloroflexota bacterium]
MEHGSQFPRRLQACSRHCAQIPIICQTSARPISHIQMCPDQAFPATFMRFLDGKQQLGPVPAPGCILSGAERRFCQNDALLPQPLALFRQPQVEYRIEPVQVVQQRRPKHFQFEQVWGGRRG